MSVIFRSCFDNGFTGRDRLDVGGADVEGGRRELMGLFPVVSRVGGVVRGAEVDGGFCEPLEGGLGGVGGARWSSFVGTAFEGWMQCFSASGTTL